MDEQAELFWCECGSEYPPQLGPYGCPNCDGVYGPAELVRLFADDDIERCHEDEDEAHDWRDDIEQDDGQADEV